jgi:phosphoribulokinase
VDTQRLAPIGYDKQGPKFSFEKTTLLMVNIIKDPASTYFYKRTRRMINDLKNAQTQIDQHIEHLDSSIKTLCLREKQFSEASKQSSGRLRDSIHKLADGLARVEKTANFDRLERYADLLERIERSLSSLAEMEKTGLLNKVSGALK